MRQQKTFTLGNLHAVDLKRRSSGGGSSGGWSSGGASARANMQYHGIIKRAGSGQHIVFLAAAAVGAAAFTTAMAPVDS
jgi:hypothetical protein